METETKQTYDILNETSNTGIKTIFKIVGFKKVLWSNWVNSISIILSLFISIICLIFKINFLDFIIEIKTLMISFLPGILGYTVAGYALMIGLIQAGMLNRITEPYDENNKYSLYQKMSSTFAINIIIQAFALFITFLFHFILYLDKNKKIDFNVSLILINYLNLFGLIIIIYFFSISLLLIVQVVINIFNFSQLHHYFINKDKIENKAKIK